MSLYAYKVLTEDGEVKQGETVSSSADELKHSLQEQGFLVQTINKKKQFYFPVLFKRKNVSPDEFLVFNQEFTALLRAGLTIPESLALIQEQDTSSKFADYIRTVLSDVKNGTPLSNACALYPDVFEKLYVSTLRTGEKTGEMAEVLSRYQTYLVKRNELNKKISQALAYPVFLLITFTLIMSVLFTFVVPRFIALYAGFSAEMPFATQVLFGIVGDFPLYLAVAVTAIVLLWFAYHYWGLTVNGGYQIDSMKSHFPVVGIIYTMQTYVQLTQTLSTLLYAGTPLVEAMKIVAGSLNNRAYAKKLTTSIRLVEEGGSLAQAVIAEDLLPDRAVGMIKVGEATGGLDAMLESVTSFYEGQLDIRLQKLMSLIEPALMLLMGVLVGGVIIIMYLPVFGMANILS